VVAQSALGGFGVVAAIAPDATAVSVTSSRLLEAFARHAVARIEAVMARQAAEASRQTAASLLRLAGSLAATTSEQEVSNCLAQEIPELVGADHSLVLRWDANDEQLTPVAYIGPAGQTPYREFTFNQAPSLADFPSQPTPLVLERSQADDFVAESMRKWDEEITVLVPLFVEGDLFALVCAGYRKQAGFDRGSALSRLQGAADLALTAYTKARLLDEIRHQALHDDLTGLPNRSLLEHRVRRSVAEAHREGCGMALLFIDLDRFKTINDSMGHKFGDTLIQHATRRIRESLDAGDFLARMGGDEFVVVLDGVDGAEKAETMAARILAQLHPPIEIDGHQVYVSASIGVAVYPDDGDEYSLLLQAADSSMYAAKRAGRGTVRRRVWTPARSPAPAPAG
jgi:diguanylate cyclase (GGDEF)-like protein